MRGVVFLAALALVGSAGAETERRNDAQRNAAVGSKVAKGSISSHAFRRSVSAQSKTGPAGVQAPSVGDGAQQRERAGVGVSTTSGAETERGSGMDMAPERQGAAGSGNAASIPLISLATKSAPRSVSAPRFSGKALERAFLCIHRHEGAWTDPDAPYWGGLQMDMEFQRTYGREFLRAWGTADHWPASVQMAVAIRAYLSGRGFWPWPNTARMCGLL